MLSPLLGHFSSTDRLDPTTIAGSHGLKRLSKVWWRKKQQFRGFNCSRNILHVQLRVKTLKMRLLDRLWWPKSINLNYGIWNFNNLTQLRDIMRRSRRVAYTTEMQPWQSYQASTISKAISPSAKKVNWSMSSFTIAKWRMEWQGSKVVTGCLEIDNKAKVLFQIILK